MSRLIRSHDWASTPLGPIADWPERLKAAVDSCLSSALPVAICWGPELIAAYNDAAIPTLGMKHPEALGRPARENWSELWPVIGPLIDQVLASGKGTRLTDLAATFDHGDGPTQAYFTVTFNPLRDADGNTVGISAIAIDTTQEKRSGVKLHLALDVGEIGAWDWDMQADTFDCSDQFYRILGYDVGEVAPSYAAWARRVHPDDLREVEAEFERVIAERRDYVGEYRLLLPDSEVRWCAGRGRYLYDDGGEPVRVFGVLQDVTEHRQLAETQQLLIAELQHRTRNLLAVVNGMARQTERASGSLDEFSGQFYKRLAALGRVQGLLSRSEGPQVQLRELVESELQAHGAAARSRQVTVRGPRVLLPSQAVQVLALALHELATNALKHGALLQEQARLSVSWEVSDGEGQRFVTIRWCEEGVDLPSPFPGWRGFGRQLIEGALPYDLGAKTTLSFAPDGVRCEIRMPLSS